MCALSSTNARSKQRAKINRHLAVTNELLTELYSQREALQAEVQRLLLENGYGPTSVTSRLVEEDASVVTMGNDQQQQLHDYNHQQIYDQPQSYDTNSSPLFIKKDEDDFEDDPMAILTRMANSGKSHQIERTTTTTTTTMGNSDTGTSNLSNLNNPKPISYDVNNLNLDIEFAKIKQEFEEEMDEEDDDDDDGEDEETYQEEEYLEDEDMKFFF